MSLTANQLEEKLDEFLDPVLSFRRTASAPALKLSQFDLSIQNQVLDWIKIISSTNAEMAFQFADFFDQAYILLDQDFNKIEQWVLSSMTAFDEKGLMAAIKIIKEISIYAQHIENQRIGASFSDKHKLLETFVCGLSGRQLSLAISPISHSYTDTQKIYLPQVIAQYEDKNANYLLYKSMLVYHWAQTRYGTFRNDIINWYDALDKQNAAAILDLFACFENIRLSSIIEQELPGFYRQIADLCQPIRTIENISPWQEIINNLKKCPDNLYSLQMAEQYHHEIEPLQTKFQGTIQLKFVNDALIKRLQKEKTLFKSFLGELLAEKKINDDEDQQLAENSKRFSLTISTPDELSEETQIDLFLDGEMISIPESMHSLLESIIQDMGELPPDYLQAAGPGAYVVKQAEDEKASVWSGTYHEDDAFFYDEWDILRKNYKKNWCVVREMNVTPVYDDFVNQVTQKHLGLIKTIRRTFEALKGEEKLLKRQVHGDDVDIDAVVEGYCDLQVGMEMPDRLFTQLQKDDRNIAVLFMVDMSGSTKGWINDAERESLILLSEALETLGDRYAIYGFSGIARKRCEIYKIKHFDDDYNDEVKARISGISAKDYTRMGFAIRHFTQLLTDIEAKTKLLITISDGKPEDYDGQYRGEYGIEDTRQALFEAKKKGIHSFCITIDEYAREYLPHMYGAANYIVIDDVSKLPLKVSEIYRKITTK